MAWAERVSTLKSKGSWLSTPSQEIHIRFERVSLIPVSQ